MNENRKKRRDWVKNAAIIFLAVMLVLTFFSNTILNYSLPEVAVQYVQPGNITAKVRGTGTIESGDMYNVQIKESRVVRSVETSVGMEVKEGDTLFFLEETQSDEVTQQEQVVESLEDAVDASKEALEAKRREIENAVLNLELKLLSGNVSNDVYESAQTGQTSSMEEYRRQILEAEAAVEKIQTDIEWYTKKISELEAAVAGANTNIETQNVTNAQNAYDIANAKIVNQQNNLEALKNAYDAAIALLQLAATVSGNDGPSLTEIADAKAIRDAYPGLSQTAMDLIESYRPEVEARLAELNAARQVLTAKQTTLFNLSTELSNRQRELGVLNGNLQIAQEAKQEILADISSQLNLSNEQAAIDDLRNDIPKLQEKVTEAEDKLLQGQNRLEELKQDAEEAFIQAPISGIISSINVWAGETAQANAPIATIQPAGKGFSMSFTVTAQQAAKLSIGMSAELVNAWRYDDVTATLKSIKPDPNNPAQQRILTFDISGSILAGQSLTLSVGDKSSQYDLLVPNSAIREDNNGKFILIVNSKNTPISTRYMASRVDVEVIASDETQSAITGGLYGYEYVITTSTRPVEAGQQVRLADN